MAKDKDMMYLVGETNIPPYNTQINHNFAYLFISQLDRIIAPDFFFQKIAIFYQVCLVGVQLVIGSIEKKFPLLNSSKNSS